MKYRILLLTADGFYRSNLAVARSLALDGHKIYVLSYFRKFSLFQKFFKSKYYHKFDFIPNPILNSKKCMEKIFQYIKSNNIDVIFPITDTFASLLSFYKDDFRDKVFLPDYKHFNRAIDKYQTVQAAEKLKIPVPFTIECKSLKDVKMKINSKDLSFPFIMKPKIRGDGLEGTKIIHDEKDLGFNYRLFRKIGNNIPIYNYKIPLIQECIKGMIFDCCTLSIKGIVKAALTQYRLRTWNPTGGAGIVNITANSKKLVSMSEAILEEINYTGPAQVEWIRDKEGDFKLLEINPRFWGTIGLSIDAGIDFPSLTMRLFENNNIIFNNLKYIFGMKKRWVFPDEILSVLKDKKHLISRFNEFFNFSEFFDPNVKSNLNKDDIKPIFYNLIFNPLQNLIK